MHHTSCVHFCESAINLHSANTFVIKVIILYDENSLCQVHSMSSVGQSIYCVQLKGIHQHAHECAQHTARQMVKTFCISTDQSGYTILLELAIHRTDR